MSKRHIHENVQNQTELKRRKMIKRVLYYASETTLQRERNLCLSAFLDWRVVKIRTFIFK